MVPGWSSRGALLALRWCQSTSTPAVLMSESTARDSKRNIFGEAIKRRLLRLYSAALVGGSPHRDYAVALGLHESRVFVGYNAVDNHFFATGAHVWRDTLTGVSPFFLASNRFIERKNLKRLIDAYALYTNSAFTIQNSKSNPWPLVLLGDGELKPHLITQCRNLGLTVIESAPWEIPPISDLRSPISDASGIVYFPGFRQVEELPRFYAAAGCFIHPALSEPWGLVVNEAMASGLPVIVSNRVGCARDLIQENINGFTFDPIDVDALTSLMQRVSAPHFPGTEFGAASVNVIGSNGPQNFASGLEAAVKAALHIGPTTSLKVELALLELMIRIRCVVSH